MIYLKNVQKFCRDDISLIENYYKAINDKAKTWDCHHRLEIELNVSPIELKELDRYFNVPANELIFLTHSEHMRLHIMNKNMPHKGVLNPMYGKKPEDFMSDEAIKEKRKKQSMAVMNNKNGRYHTKQMYKDGVYKTVKYENIEEHLNDGWIIKGKSWHESK